MYGFKRRWKTKENIKKTVSQWRHRYHFLYLSRLLTNSLNKSYVKRTYIIRETRISIEQVKKYFSPYFPKSLSCLKENKKLKWKMINLLAEIVRMQAAMILCFSFLKTKEFSFVLTFTLELWMTYIQYWLEVFNGQNSSHIGKGSQFNDRVIWKI